MAVTSFLLLVWFVAYLLCCHCFKTAHPLYCIASAAQYYFVRDVDRILTNVVQELTKAPDRRFVWSEVSFFMRWWGEQAYDVKQTVRRLVQSGQLEFVGGGWVQVRCLTHTIRA